MSSNEMSVCNQTCVGIGQLPLVNYSSPEIKVVRIVTELGFAGSIEDHVIDPVQPW